MDVVFGAAILHHLELERSLAEIYRVLRPGGRAVFAEPLDSNPVGRLVRALTPAARTKDERPFRFADLELVRRAFPGVKFYYEQLFSVPFGVISGFLFASPENPLTRLAFRLDEAALSAFPALGPYCRVVFFVADRN